MMTKRVNPVFCALDTPDVARAEELAGLLAPCLGGIKLGLEFFNANGPDGYRTVATAQLPVFLDLKLHDIPNTVAGAMRALVPLAPALVTVHTSGGAAMLRAAAEAAAEASQPPKIIGVTVLTSLDDGDLEGMGVGGGAAEQVKRLAALAQDSGLDGVVCSPREITNLRAQCGDDFTLVVPGIRPKGADAGDQKRVMTPGEAVSLGADILVVGRPITAAADPRAAAEGICQEIAVHGEQA